MDETNGPARGDLLRLLRHRPTVFPEAKITLEQIAGTKLNRLVGLLLSPDLPDKVSTKEIGEKLGVDWGNSNLPRLRHFQEIVESAGWKYHTGKGRRRGSFSRLKPVGELHSQVEVHSQQTSAVDL
jgi:hypothetical protein